MSHMGSSRLGSVLGSFSYKGAMPYFLRDLTRKEHSFENDP